MTDTDINPLNKMIGEIIVKARGATPSAEAIIFEMSNGQTYVFYHEQNCCESVCVEDVCGDINDIVGSPLIMAEEVTSTDSKTTDPFTGVVCDTESDYDDDSQTWTFYKFGTINGSVTIRWLGQSNGYYSESVDLKVYEAGEKVPEWLIEETKTRAERYADNG